MNGMEERMAHPGDVIVRDPEVLGGMPVFRGTRVPFKNLLDYLEGGHTLDEFLQEFPSVTRDAAIAALERAKELMSEYSEWLDRKVKDSMAAAERGEIVPDEQVRNWIEHREEFKPIEIRGEPLSETIRRGRG